MEIKSFPAEFKVDVDEGVFEGYASVFGNVDSWGDIVERGAFKKTLQENAHRVKVLWQHDWFTPIGKPLHMEEDAKGLFTRTKVAPTQQGKDALVLLREGVINELSIGYDPIKWTHDQETDVRHLHEVRLWEYSPVTFAANELARVTGVKQLDELRPLLQEVRGLQALATRGQRLSKTQLSLVEEAVSALKALLREFKGDGEPDDSTPPADESKGAAIYGPDGKPAEGHSLEAELSKAVEPLSAWAMQQRILAELRGFGKSLKGAS